MEGRKTIGDGFSLYGKCATRHYPGSRPPSFDNHSAGISSSPTFRLASKVRASLSSHRSASSSTDRRSRSNSRPPSSISRSSYSSSLVDDFFFFSFSEGKQIFLRKRTIRWNDESIKMRSNDEIDRWNFKYLKI